MTRRGRSQVLVLGGLLVTLGFLGPKQASGQMLPGNSLDAHIVWGWGPTAVQYPNVTDVWSPPAVARILDTNGDGIVDQNDDPSIVFISGNDLQVTPLGTIGTNCQSTGSSPSACHTGALRVLNGRTGAEQFSLDRASANSSGFAGLSVAVGDIIGNGTVQIAAVTGEGFVVLIGRSSAPMAAPLSVLRASDKPIPGNADAAFGWGGGLAIADMDGDGFPEIAFNTTVFRTDNGGITLRWTGGVGGAPSSFMGLSTFANLGTGMGLQLVAGNAAYRADGTILWSRADLPGGFNAVADFDGDGSPDVVLVGGGGAAGGRVWILNGATGATEYGPATLPGTGSGGPPVIADFDGDGRPEIGVATAATYLVLKPQLVTSGLNTLWQNPTHDLSSSVTGSIAFDFDGSGHASVVYSDECFLWVFDGATGAVRFAASHTSFTGTEEPIVADVDGNGKAEIVMVSNGNDPSASGCLDAAHTPVTVNGVTWQPGPGPGQSYRGITVFGSAGNTWPGAPVMWNEHTFHVSNINDGTNGLYPTLSYGAIPRDEVANWSVSGLNTFRQNVQRSLSATTTTLAASASPAIEGQPTTFTATVAPVSDARTPTGSVTFKDGAASLGSRPLSGGQAALTVSTLTVGAHVITAAYSGDSIFSGSSAVLNEHVQAASCIGSSPAPCTAADQCHVAGVCDQQTGFCSNPTAADGTACNDGNPCTRIDTCQAGTCAGSNTIVCTASDPCHVAGVCDAGTGLCSNPPAADGTSCGDDGQFCNGQEACFGGTCTHQGSPCQKGQLCDPANGACVECLVGSDCKSGTCTGGICAGGSGCPPGQVTCGGVCRDLSSDPANCGACGHVCSTGDSCVSGVCQAASTCTDGLRNGSETDVDCGGGACPRCDTDGACIVSSDCQSHVCTCNLCSAAGGTALLRVHYPAGMHAVTVRGSAGGLSWTLGQPTAASGDTFTYALVGLTTPAEWKPLLDDATWSRGPNYHVAPGQIVDVWPHFTTTHGRVVTLIAAFHSTVLGNDRAIYAYLPASYDENTDATYPVVYMQDGQNLWAAHPELAFGATWDVDAAFDVAAETGACSAGGLAGWGAQPLGGTPLTCTGDGDCPSDECRTFPEAIVIGVFNNADRIYEYTPTTDPGTPGGGGADGYIQMLAGELKPTIDATLRTRPGVGSTAIAGSSLGGLVSAYAALQRPDVYGLVAEFSPSTFWNGDVIVSDVAGTLPAPARPQIVYVDSGAGAADGQADTDLLAAQYLALGYVDGVNFRHVVQLGASHSEVFWAERFPGAMQLLLGVRGGDAQCAGASCTDSVKNGSETDVDCGGGVCSPCGSGKACLVNGDCQSGTCTSGVCRAAATCSDGVQNGSETGVDCGGVACLACPTGCLIDANCGDSDSCTIDTCVAHACVHAPVVCVAQDQCHDAGTCEPTGLCSNPAKPAGTSCSDGNACTQADTCQDGVCRSLSYAWTGVLQPINADGTSIFKLGSTVPVKFKLTTPCVPTGSFTAKIFLAKVTSDILGSEVEATSTSAADAGNTFRYDASGDQYIYNLATKAFTNGSTTPLSAGTWQIRIAQYNGTTEIGTMGTVVISLKK